MRHIRERNGSTKSAVREKAMEHQLQAELVQIAELYDGKLPPAPMSVDDRLRRWVKLLDAQSSRKLDTLIGTEYRPREHRDAMRGDNTVMTVAFEDPVLREEGLAGDTYGDAKRFFRLSDRQLHFVVCYCHNGYSMSAGTAARLLEAFLPIERGSGLLRRALQAFCCVF